MKNLELSNKNGNTYSILCENRETNDLFNEDTKTFKCFLSSNDKTKNRLPLFM